MELFFRQFGEGQSLIILHGLFGQSDNWNTLAKKFAEHGLKVYIVDLRNHGQSPHSDEMSYETMARDIAELIQKENIENPVLLGHSMGGKVAMMFDYLFPKQLKKLIVVDIAPKEYPSGGHADVFKALFAVNFNEIKNRKEAENILRNYLKEEAVIQFLLKNIYWETAEKLNWRFNLNAIHRHYNEIIGGLPFYTSTTSALFIRGEKSRYITDGDISMIKKYYPNANIITIPNAGHWVHAEQPQLFFDAVLNFVRE